MPSTRYHFISLLSCPAFPRLLFPQRVRFLTFSSSAHLLHYACAFPSFSTVIFFAKTKSTKSNHQQRKDQQQQQQKTQQKQRRPAFEAPQRPPLVLTSDYDFEVSVALVGNQGNFATYTSRFGFATLASAPHDTFIETQPFVLGAR